MFTGSKKVMYWLLATTTAVVPYTSYLWSGQETSATIERLTLENAALENALRTRNGDDKTLDSSALHIVWDDIVNLAKGFSHLKIQAVTTPPFSAPASMVYWWGKCEGDAKQLLAFVQRVKDIDSLRIHSFSQKNGQAILLFFIVADKPKEKEI